MGKFRSKLTRNVKGKKWSHGQSSTSNPTNQKHRSKAKSRFFQPNLSLVPQPSDTKPSPLTLDALIQHDARQSYKTAVDPTVNDIAHSMKSCSIDGEDMVSESQGGTFKTFQTFASNWSACSNMSFSKLLTGFRNDSPLHKEMLAILAALTEVITERGGTQSSTEYFMALMETLDACAEEKGAIPAVSLLAMGIKTVPQAVLRKKFSPTGETLIGLMERFVYSENENTLRSIIGCLSVLLRAQEYSQWSLPVTARFFDSILMFCVHSKPKIRKAAQHAVVSIIHGSCFMLPVKDESDPESEPKPSKVTYHPVGNRVAKFCTAQFTPDNIAASQPTVMHTLCLLRDTVGAFKGDDIKTMCETILSIMTAANLMIRTNCFHTLHALFAVKTVNLPSTVAAKLIAALYDYRPDKTDARQTLAWLTVLKQGHMSLAASDLTLCSNALPKFVDTCAIDLWASDKVEVVTGTSNALKEILYDCVRPCAETKKLASQHKNNINRVIASLAKSLATPFGHVANQVVLTFSVVFEVAGKYFSDALERPLALLSARYDAHHSSRVQIEHAIVAAISAMGPCSVLNAIPLADSTGDMSLSRSWILPLLREGINEASFEFFANHILKMAAACNAKWLKNKAENNTPMAHTYELLCCQLWGLFPGFCRRPTDVANFKFIAKTLGTVLSENPELHAPVIDGLKELVKSVQDSETDREEVARFAKNFLPRLFNIYTTKPKGTFQASIRETTLVLIKDYLSITPANVLCEMFETASEQLKTNAAGSFIGNAVFDIVELMAVFQTAEKLQELYEKFIVAILRQQKEHIVAKVDQKLRRQQKKAYKLLENILASDKSGCVKFVAKNRNAIRKLLSTTIGSTCTASRVARITCLNILVDSQMDQLSVDDKLVRQTVPEIVLSFNDFKDGRNNVAQELLKKIGDLFKAEDKLGDFVDIIIAGFAGDTQLIANTMLALRSVMCNHTGDLTVSTLEFLLEQVSVFLVGRNREQATAALSFVIAFVRVLPAPLIANHLNNIMRTLSAMVPDTKRNSRLQLGFLLRKLAKKFGAVELIKIVPGDDELMHKRLKKIKKDLAREKRQKVLDKNQKSENDSDDDAEMAKKSYTIDDILGDSDSEIDNSDAEERPAKRSNKKQETYIQEDPDTIVDLADIKSISKISSSKPTKRVSGDVDATEAKKKRDANRGFKTANDGRLIIADQSASDSGDSDGDEDELPKKRGIDESSDDSDDDGKSAAGPSRKRKAMETASQASGRSGTSSRYVAGGKGIHRPVAASVKSGYTSKSAATTKSAGSNYGKDYKAKKAAGDVKRQGKHDPYAYIPLSRNNLNKRKRAKNAGQFKNIVKGARKGAAAGSKSRIQKSFKNK